VKVAKWWDLAFGAGLPVLAFIAWVGYSPSQLHLIGAWITLAVIGLCYFTFGRRALATRSLSMPFALVLIVGCGVATACSPTLATMQALAIPYLWSITRTRRPAIVLNTALVTSVAIGFLFSLGFTVDSLVQAVLTEALSLAFSIVLGLWISSIAESGEERGRLLDELTAAQEQLAAGHRQAGIASERERLAREIHDTIAQSLTSLVMLAQRTRSELARLPGDTSAAADSVELIESTARDALTDARSLVAALAPIPVGESSLADVMSRLAARFDRETGVRVTAEVSATAVPRELEVVLLRCAQEGLANVRKHAQASEARVTVERTGDQVRLEVHDNGRGLAADSLVSDRGFGLGGMRERVGLVGGHLQIDGAAGAGTTLVVTIPIGEGGSVDVAEARS
jgi:signal transduction histidine kinase